jgi:hypothetical protein
MQGLAKFNFKWVYWFTTCQIEELLFKQNPNFGFSEGTEYHSYLNTLHKRVISTCFGTADTSDVQCDLFLITATLILWLIETPFTREPAELYLP